MVSFIEIATLNRLLLKRAFTTRKKPDLLQSGYRLESKVQKTQNVLSKFALFGIVDDAVGVKQSLHSSCRAIGRRLALTDATDEKYLPSQACQLHHGRSRVR